MKPAVFFATVVAVLGTGAAVHALADYRGPGSETFLPQQAAAPATVASLLEAGQDDQPVTLVGYIVRQTGRKEFLFRDDSGEILLEIDKDAMPARAFDETTRVRISGELEMDEGKPPIIEVESVLLD